MLVFNNFEVAIESSLCLADVGWNCFVLRTYVKYDRFVFFKEYVVSLLFIRIKIYVFYGWYDVNRIKFISLKF